MTKRFLDSTEMIAECKVGEAVTIRTPHNQLRRGRATILSGTHVALNMGGRHGTPGIATPTNVVRIGRFWSVTDGFTYDGDGNVIYPPYK